MNANNFIVVVPTFNNPLTIKSVAFDILNHGYKIIIVDDGSDVTIESLFEPNEKKDIVFVRNEKNQGKGIAIINGVKKAHLMGYSYVVTLDGDGQHPASQIKNLVEVCIENTIIIGARNFDIENIPKGSRFGRWFSNFWACWDTGYKITDSLSGFRLYPMSILELDIQTRGFDWEMEVIVKHADSGKPIKEVLIECYYPSPEDRVSHFRKYQDTMAIIWVHVRILPFKWLKYFKNLLLFSK